MNRKHMSVLVSGLVLAFVLTAFSAPALAAQAPEKKVNINTASLAELQKLPRIGPVVAQRIIDYREKHGNFKRIEEIMKVKGIGEKTFLKIKDLITVGTVTKAKKEKGV
ncbi:MAG: helix-hairpin-helix domain-containing protein [Candidatus Aminicenantales bacterium]